MIVVHLIDFARTAAAGSVALMVGQLFAMFAREL